MLPRIGAQLDVHAVDHAKMREAIARVAEFASSAPDELVSR